MIHNLCIIILIRFGHMIGLFWNVPILGPNSVAYFELFHFSFQMAKNQYLIWRLKSTAHDTIKYWLMFRIFKSHFSPFMFFIKKMRKWQVTMHQSDLNETCHTASSNPVLLSRKIWGAAVITFSIGKLLDNQWWCSVTCFVAGGFS